MTTTILKIATLTAVLLSQISKCMLSANDCNANSLIVACKTLTIFDLSEDYSRENMSSCSETEVPEWVKKILHYFNYNKNKTDKTDKEHLCKEGRERLRVGTKQLLRMLIYSLNELPCSNQIGIDGTKFSNDVINAFHTFPPPTQPNYINLACHLNEKWKIDTFDQAMYIMDCILRPSLLLNFSICDKV